MWKPPERIKYQTAVERWPTAAEAERSRLYSPLSAPNLDLAQRTWVPAMVPWRASAEGDVTQDVIDWYVRFAQGKPGAIVVEATGIRDIPSGPLLRISDDRYVAGLQRLNDAVRKASDGQTRLLIQLIDFLTIRRRPQPEAYFNRFLEITETHRQRLSMEREDEQAVRQRLCTLTDAELEKVLSARELESLRAGYRERVTDTDLPAIAALPETLPLLFSQAATRAQAAGFDGVELHYAHAYTMASFLSATNSRTDGYGGSREHRVRLPLEVYHGVRAAVGDDYAVGCRFLSDEIIEAGSDVDDACFFATEFARAGMDTGSGLPASLLVNEAEGYVTVADDALKDLFYGDCSGDDVELARLSLQPEALAPLNTPVSISAENFGRVPRVYIECLDDRAISIDAQRSMHERTPCEQVLTMATSHSPFFSAPDELTELLISLAD